MQVLDVETFRLWKKLQENGSSIDLLLNATERHTVQETDGVLIRCKNCWPESEKACPVPGSLWWILDKQMPAIYPERALHTLPRGFAVKESSMPGAGQGVWTLQDVPPCSIIGPYWGELVDFRQANGRTDDYAFALPSGLHRDAANETMSNWVRYINCPHFENQQNLVSEEFDGEIYYRTLFEIPAGSELLVWYGDIYGDRLRQKHEEKHLLFKPRSNK